MARLPPDSDPTTLRQQGQGDERTENPPSSKSPLLSSLTHHAAVAVGPDLLFLLE